MKKSVYADAIGRLQDHTPTAARAVRYAVAYHARENRWPTTTDLIRDRVIDKSEVTNTLATAMLQGWVLSYPQVRSIRWFITDEGRSI